MDRMTHVFVLLLFVACVSLPPGCKAEGTVDEEELAVQRWTQTISRLKKALDMGIKAAMPFIMSGLSENDLQLSQECRRGLFLWISDLKSMKPWALKLVDSSAKGIDGILTGTLSAYGSFDQCLDTVNPKGTVRGKYCSVQAWPALPPKPRFYAINKRLKAFERFENNTGAIGEFTKYIQLFYMFPLRLGVCIPSMCSANDLESITSLVAKRFLHINITVPRCDVREPVVIENYQIPILCVVTILFGMVTIGSLYELLIYRRRKYDSLENLGFVSNILMAFSAPSNWNKLMDTTTGAENLSVLHGIRFFSMLWIVLGHTYFHLNFNILKHLQITIEMTTQVAFNAITNASVLVDNFFFLSGLLFVFVTMDMMKVIGRMPSPLHFLIHRVWRFFPMQMFFVGCATLLPLMGDGPVWHENIDPIVDGCKKDWWANMIFINNFYRSSTQGCLSYSWFLASDFQVYVICIPIVILIIRKPRIGLWVNFVVIMLSAIAVAVHTYVRDLPPTMLFIHSDVEQRYALMRETYYTPYQHLGPHCIGVFVGYYLHTYKKPIKMHWTLHTAAWITAFLLKSAVLFGVYPWNRGAAGTGIVPTVMYACLYRIAWTLGLAWITVACTVGHGGVLSRLLRSNAFIPLSRLTFLVYMVHPLVQHVFYATLRDGVQALNHFAIFIAFGFICSSYGIALILSVFVESPFINLGKIIFAKTESVKKRKRVRSLSGERGNKIPTPVANGYGKCNGAFENHSDMNKTQERNERSNGDFICHL